MSTVGYVYVLRNEYINLVKIGYTDRNPQDRAQELSNFTGVPGKWRVCKSWRLPNAYNWEQRIFKELAAYRKDGEFFRLTPEKAIDLITLFLLNLNAINSDGLTQIELNEKRERNAEHDKRTKRLGVDQKWKNLEIHYQKLAQKEAERIFGRTLEQITKEEKKEEENYNKSIGGIAEFVWGILLIFTVPFWFFPVMIYKLLFTDGQPSGGSFPFFPDRENQHAVDRYKINKMSSDLLIGYRKKFYYENGVLDDSDT